MFGLMPSPRSATLAASAGQSHHLVRPTTSGPAPIANSSSVVEGAREATRVAGLASRVVSPASSTSTRGPAESGALPHAIAKVKASQAKDRDTGLNLPCASPGSKTAGALPPQL